MYRPLVASVAPWVFACLVACLAPATAGAQTSRPQDLATMSLEDLMAIEISTASKFPQSVREAPASITIVTAQDIRRFGYRTLADILRSVRGFYSTYDRNYSYVGMRGFARPGDYNTRVLLLVDGHRVNDGVYDMAPMGTDFLFDVALIERVEVIRGPGSSLYGTNALFGVINVITKSGAARNGIRVDGLAGSLTTLKALGSYGHATSNGSEVLLAGSVYRSHGQDRIHIPEFDEGAAQAIAVGLDDDRANSVFGSWSAGHFSLRGGMTHRVKQIPTASFGTAFGDSRSESTDDRAFISGTYDGPIGAGWLGTGRLAYDYYYYQGQYPTVVDGRIDLFTDYSRANSVTGEFTARRRVGQKHLFTAGTEVRRDFQNRLWASNGSGRYLDLDVPGTKAAVYVQDEVRPVRWLLLNAGLRIDKFTEFGTRTTPRASLVLLPRQKTAVKLLHGRAFRAPNPYERYYYTSASARSLDLRPEQIRSTELVWEESLTYYVRVTASAFAYDVEQIIEQRATDVGDIFFVNAGRTRGRGVEAEAEVRLDNGIVVRVSHAMSRVTDMASHDRVSNSPQHLSMFSAQAPISKLVLGIEGHRVGERLNINGSTLPSFFTSNLSLSTGNDARVGFTLSVYNAFDRQYLDPGAEEHRQPAIEQDGRVALLRVNVRF